MSVKTRLQTLNKRLADELCSRFVSASADETTTALIAKLTSAPRFLSKSTDLRPWRLYTTYPAFTAEDGTVTEPGIEGTWHDDDSVELTSLVPLDRAWPHAECTFETTPRIKVSGARLLVDAEHTAEFNMVIGYTSPDGVTRIARLSDMAGIATTDFARGRTSLMVNFGSYIIQQGHTNPPTVSSKYDLLNLATGQPSNYLFTGGQVSFGKNGDTTAYLMTDTINLNDTPYLYYSISQDTTSGCTFGLYSENPWYMFRDGTDTTAPTMNTDADSYGVDKWIFGEQTGCVDLRNYVDSSKWAAFKVHELKLYGNTDGTTAATFNYLFFGSEPTTVIDNAWGEPATPSTPIRPAAAVGGTVYIQKIHYFVVGAESESVILKQSTFANEYVANSK